MSGSNLEQEKKPKLKIHDGGEKRHIPEPYRTISPDPRNARLSWIPTLMETVSLKTLVILLVDRRTVLSKSKPRGGRVEEGNKVIQEYIVGDLNHLDALHVRFRFYKQLLLEANPESPDLARSSVNKQPVEQSSVSLELFISSSPPLLHPGLFESQEPGPLFRTVIINTIYDPCPHLSSTQVKGQPLAPET
ncbi:hypothetical protein PQX77_016958 [Marasmius sp. AFHP31]|nr:hypothetical protein PQX77_016958 [Marasmius sp. AFHP31]